MTHSEILATLQYSIDLFIWPVWILMIWMFACAVRYAWTYFQGDDDDER